MAYQYAEARRCNGVAVGVCALGVVLGCGCSWREAAGSFAMVWRLCALMSFGGVVAHGCEAAQIGARVCGRCGVSTHGIEVARIVSEGAPGLSRCKIQYIYNVLEYYQTKMN